MGLLLGLRRGQGRSFGALATSWLQWGSAVPGEEAWENAERCKSLKSTVART